MEAYDTGHFAFHKCSLNPDLTIPDIYPFFLLYSYCFSKGQRVVKGMPATSASKSVNNLYF